ncbi:GcrA family cell cycle regulator [Oceanimonas smirnovii]|uniref:GcrA family cell cycle regulator n=1 Tax=Oceanimonas smirnovii TaxID=264574 RepID=UPI003AACDB99
MTKGHKKSWTKAEVELLRKGYSEGTPTLEIAAQLNRSWRSVRGKAHRLGLSHAWRDKQLYSQDEDLFICNNAQKLTRYEIAQTLGRTEGSVSQRGIRLGVTFENISKMSRYDKNHDYFSVPTIENSYLAGLLAADGWIKPKNGIKVINMVGISLSRRDLHLIEYIRDITGYTGVIRHYDVDGHHQSELRICAVPQWIDDLKKHWNVTPNKTFTLKPPNENNLTSDQLLAYHVGLIDGDGYIDINNGTLRISLCTASSSMADWLELSWGRIAGAAPSRGPHKNNTVHYISFYGNNARSLCKKLMSLNIHKLERKWSVAESEIAKFRTKDFNDQTQINR